MTRNPLQNPPVGEFSDPEQALMVREVQEDGQSKLGIFKAVYSGRASPRQAIKGFCLECVWLDEAAIRECTSTACCLWRFRPYQRQITGGVN